MKIRPLILVIIILIALISGCVGEVDQIEESDESSQQQFRQTIVEEPTLSYDELNNTDEKEFPEEMPFVEEAEEEKEYVVTGYVRDCSFMVGENVPVASAKINYENISVKTSENGHFAIRVKGDPELLITAEGYHDYKEKSSGMVTNAFYLIPNEVYKDLYTVVWEKQVNSPNNWMRKWTRQPEIIVIKENGTDGQVNFVVSSLKSNVFNKMTGGLYSSENITVLDEFPEDLYEVENRDGKIIIHFTEKMMDGYEVVEGGSGFSSDKEDGNITFAEIGWLPTENLHKFAVFHELMHTVTTGGHINYKPSIVSEVESTFDNEPTKADYRLLNCVYNSPLKRSN